MDTPKKSAVVEVPKKNMGVDAHYKDKLLECSRQIQVFGPITKRHMADIHERILYLKATVKYGGIEDQRDIFLQRLEALKNSKDTIAEYRKMLDLDEEVSDWEILKDINEKSVSNDMKILLDAIGQCDKILEMDDQITIWLNSGGGNIIDGLAIIDMINSCEFPVEIIATGEIQSMAIPIIASGTKGYRKATKNAIFMMHDSACGAYGGANEIDATSGFLKMLDKKIKAIVVKRTNLKAKQFDELNQYTPYYFDAKKALELGIIDEII